MAENKINDIDSLLTKLTKEHGEGVVQLGSSYTGSNIKRWDVSSPLISYVLGGGIPKGRIIEMYGPESSGKTSLACYLAGEVQKQGESVLYIDAENAADLEYAQTMGLDSSKVLLNQPSSGEQALDVAIKTAETGLVKFIIIDSVSALTPQAEIDGEMGDQQMGLQARLIGKGLRKLSAICARNQVTIVFVNQIRMKIGVMFGSPETTSGGKALKFYSSIRLDVRKVEFLSKGQESPYGLITRITAKKNKTAPPMRKGHVTIVFGKGIQYHEEYVDFAVQYDIINKSASWFTLPDEKGNMTDDKLQGKDKVIQFLVDNPSVFEYIKNRVNMCMNPQQLEEDNKEEEKTQRKSKKSKDKDKEETIELEE